SETYFETLGIALVRGRGFTKQEARNGTRSGGAGRRSSPEELERAARVAVVSESAARRFWPNEDPLGKRFKLDMDFRGKLFAEFEVIGIAKDVRFTNLTRIDPAHVYLATNAADPSLVLMRVNRETQSAMAAVRAAARDVDPNLSPSLSLFSLEEGMRLQ